MKGWSLSLLLIASLHASSTNATWNVDTDGDWNTGANWTGSVPPNDTDAVAAFGKVITDARTVTLNVDVKVGALTLDNANDYTIAPDGKTLTFEVSSSDGNGSITVTNANGNGAHTVDVPIALLNPLIITQSSTGNFTISGAISGAQSLKKSGSQTLILSGTNTYTEGTTVDAGTLSITIDANLGDSAGALSIGNATLTAAGSFDAAGRAVTLTGGATVDTGANTVTLHTVGGSGSLTKQSAGTLILSGTCDYSGGTTVSAGMLQGDTDSLQGAIVNKGNVTFNQGTDGTYSGVISGAGTLTKSGAGMLTLTGANTFSGAATVSAGILQGDTLRFPSDISVASGATVLFNQTPDGTYAHVLSGAGALTKAGAGILVLSQANTITGTATINEGNLQVTGSLASATVEVASAGVLSGTGTVQTVNCTGGTISPGASIGTLTVQGDLTLDGASTTVIEVAPLSTDLLAVTGMATIDGALAIDVTPGFYGLNTTYTIVTGAPVSGTFATSTISNENFIASLSYPGTSVQLTLGNLKPFADFPFDNANEESVGNNIDALSTAGELSADLTDVINALVGQSFAVVNDALDQMQPAQLSAFAEIQSAVGTGILSIFHRKPQMLCGCRTERSIWIEPFGDWLRQKGVGMQTGFRSHTWGIAIGFDGGVPNEWTVGAGIVGDQSTLHWRPQRGTGNSDGLYGALYAEGMVRNWRLGAVVLGGCDWIEMTRHIQFTTIDEDASSSSRAVDCMGQVSAAYMFGSPACHLYPFAHGDVFYLQTRSFAETGAGGLNLSVGSYESWTIRTEAGVGFEVSDKNRGETICFAPLVALGWTMDLPLSRSPFTSRFAGASIPFQTTGWDKTWQLLTVRFGLDLTFGCFTLTGEYVGEFSTDKNSAYNHQRANARLNFQF